MIRRRLMLAVALLGLGACAPPDRAATAAGGEIRLSPEQDVNAIVADAPPGARFVLADGLYRGFTAEVKDGQAFVAEGGAGVLDGSIVLDQWRREGGHWVHDLPPAQPNPTAEADPGSFALQVEDLFLDDRLLRPVGSTGELDDSTWHRSGDRAYLAFDPSGRLLELGLLPHAFHGAGENVLIQGVTVRQYAPPAQYAAIEAARGRGWRIVEVTAEHNHSRGLSLNQGIRVEGGHFNDNGQLGIGGPADDALIEGVEIARNNYAGHGRLWEAGGIKIVQSKGVVFRGNHVHHNDGTGVWFDWDNRDILIEDNLVELNQLMGIQYEASRDGVIRNNRVLRNDQSGYDVAWWGAEVLVQNSRNVEVIENVIGVEHNTGLMIVQQDRGGGDFGEHLAQGNRIEGNLFVHLTPGRQHGLFADHKPDEASGNVFARNRYVIPEADAGRPLWQLPGGAMAWPAIRSIGWEEGGEVVPVADPAAYLPPS